MIVVNYFRDKTDKHEYNPGDVYPREDTKPSEERIAELTSRGYISQEPVEEKKPAKKAASKKKKE